MKNISVAQGFWLSLFHKKKWNAKASLNNCNVTQHAPYPNGARHGRQYGGLALSLPHSPWVFVGPHLCVQSLQILFLAFFPACFVFFLQ